MLISFLFLNKNICCGYSLEAPWRGASNEYPQYMFSSRNKEIIMWILPLICSYGRAVCPNSSVSMVCFCRATVNLAYATYQQQIGEDLEMVYPLIIQHGMMGSRANWHTLARMFTRTGRKVIFEPAHDKICNKTCATSEDSDQLHISVVSFWRRNVHNTG